MSSLTVKRYKKVQHIIILKLKGLWTLKVLFNDFYDLCILISF